MKITLEQIAPYLPHKVGYINTATKKTGIVNTTNLHLFFMNEALNGEGMNILSAEGRLSASFSMICKTPVSLMDVEFEHCEIVCATWNDYQLLLSHGYDFTDLIGQGVAVAINTTL